MSEQTNKLLRDEIDFLNHKLNVFGDVQKDSDQLLKENRELKAKFKTLIKGFRSLKSYDLETDNYGDENMVHKDFDLDDGYRGDYVETEDVVNLWDKIDPELNGGG